MVEQFEEIAKSLEGEGYDVGAFKTRKFYEDLFSRREIPESIKSKLPDHKEEAPVTERVLRYPDFTYYPDLLLIEKGTGGITLTSSENTIFECMASRPMQIFSQLFLINLLGKNEIDFRTIDSHIAHLRNKIEPSPRITGRRRKNKYIQNVYSFGWRFDDQSGKKLDPTP